MKGDPELKQRTQSFALRVIKVVDALPPTKSADVIACHLARAGTLLGAHYRTALYARSITDFISKMVTVAEEADESAYWSELLIESDLAADQPVHDLLREANELLALIEQTIKAARKRK